MTRRLLNLLTLLSLLLCIAVMALWVRSYVTTDTLRITTTDREAKVVFTRGAAEAASRARGEVAGVDQVSIEFGTRDRPREPDYFPDPSYERPRIIEWKLDGSGTDRPAEVGPPPGPGWVARPFEAFRTVPLALPAAALVALPAARLVLYWRDRRRHRSEPSGIRPPAARIIARVVSGASVVILTLALMGWVDSATWHGQGLIWQGEQFAQVGSPSGRCELQLWVDWRFIRGPSQLSWSRGWVSPAHRSDYLPEPARLELLPWFGFELYDNQLKSILPSAVTPSRVAGVVVRVPYWSVVLLAAIQPTALLVRRWRSRRRLRANCCVLCGYDIRATPDRCPECGLGVGRGAVAS